MLGISVSTFFFITNLLNEFHQKTINKKKVFNGNLSKGRRGLYDVNVMESHVEELILWFGVSVKTT